MTFDITEGTTITLGLEAGSAASYTNSGVSYDYAIAGLPFLSAASDQWPMERALAQVRKAQVDQSDAPGDQTFDGWWLRSATDWSGGAGNEYMEPIADSDVQRSFYRSVGVNPWTPGRLSLHRSMIVGTTYSTSDAVIWQNALGGFYVGVGASVHYYYPPWGTYTTMEGFAGNAVDITGGGGKVFLATNNSGTVAIYTISEGGYSFASAITGIVSTTPRVWYAKQRLLVADGDKLYVMAPTYTGAISGATLLYTHPDTGFTWTDVAEAPGAILASGYGSGGSGVYRFTVDNTGALPTMTGAVTTAEMPLGERITALATYLGSYALLATNKGVRVAQVAENGTMQYGPLTYEGEVTGRWAKYDTYAYIGVADCGGGRAGLLRFDLSDVRQDGRCAYATDMQISDTGTDGSVAGAAVFGAGSSGVWYGDVWILAKATSGGTWKVYRPSWSPEKLEESGWLDTGFIRYGTTEPKNYDKIRLEVRPTFYGSVGIDTYTSAYSYTSLTTVDGSTDLSEPLEIAAPTSPQRLLGFRFTLNRSTGTPAQGPTLDSWQVRSLPAVARQELMRIPLLCFDNERDQYGQLCGYEGSAVARYQALRDAIRDGGTVRWQDLNTGEAMSVVCEELSFQQTAPPERASGFGGILTITVRSV